jgi:hypothetical protein
LGAAAAAESLSKQYVRVPGASCRHTKPVGQSLSRLQAMIPFGIFALQLDKSSMPVTVAKLA